MYPEIPVLSLISAALGIVPLVWYHRAGNIAALAIGIWLSVTNLTYAVDALVWAEDTDNKAGVWCDIATAVMTGSHIALPAGCLAVCIHLERLASFSSQISIPRAKIRRVVFDCVMCFGIPVLYIVLHLVVQPRRFDIFYGFGCRPATYPAIATIFLVLIPPLFLTVATLVYAGIAWRHFFAHGVQYYRKRDRSSVTRNLYLRLVGMAVVEAVFSAVSIAVAMWGILSPGLAPLGIMSRRPSEVLTFGPEAIAGNVLTVLEIEWSVTVVQSCVFFGLFACRMDVVREGWGLIGMFLRLLKRPNLSATLFGRGGVEQSESRSITLPMTPIDLSLMISTHTQCDHLMDKTDPSSSSTAIE